MIMKLLRKINTFLKNAGRFFHIVRFRLCHRHALASGARAPAATNGTAARLRSRNPVAAMIVAVSCSGDTRPFPIQ
jgi:hypothetical protein